MATTGNDAAGSAAVHTGFWIDRSRGPVYGATLTIIDSHATVLLAFLAVLVTFTGTRSWKFWRFILHFTLQTPKIDPWETPFHRLRDLVLLRNSETAGSTLWTLIFPPQSKTKFKKRGWMATLSFGSFAAAHLLVFIAAGILTSRTFIGRTVVSKVTDTCGQWLGDPVTVADEASYILQQELQLNQTVDAENYVRNCYDAGTSRQILNCGKFVTQSLPHIMEKEAPCPFQNSTCLTGNQSITLDSENITLAQMGINSKFASRLTIRKRSTCAVLDPKLFEVPASLLGLDNGKPSSSYVFEMIDGALSAHTFFHTNISVDYDLRSLTLSAFKTEDLVPQVRLATTDHTVSVILLGGGGIMFPETHDDPFFSVHREIKFNDPERKLDPGFKRFELDRLVNIIGCDEQAQLCSSITDRCGPWRSLFNVDYTLPTVLGGANLDDDELLDITASVTLLQLILPTTSIPMSIQLRQASSALQASRYFLQATQFYLHPNQWAIELNYWFSIALARLQLELFNTIERPPHLDAARAHNTWTGTPLMHLCGRVKFNSPDHMSLSALGLGLILALAVLLIAVSFVDEVAVWALNKSERRSKRRGVGAWEQTEMFSLLDAAVLFYENRGALIDPFLMDGEDTRRGGKKDRSGFVQYQAEPAGGEYARKPS